MGKGRSNRYAEKFRDRVRKQDFSVYGFGSE